MFISFLRSVLVNVWPFFCVFISSMLCGFDIKFIRLSCLQRNTFICFGFLVKFSTTESHLINLFFGSVKFQSMLREPTHAHTHTHIRCFDKKWGRLFGCICKSEQTMSCISIWVSLIQKTTTSQWHKTKFDIIFVYRFGPTKSGFGSVRISFNLFIRWQINSNNSFGYYTRTWADPIA